MNPYEVLGLERTADAHAIKAAWRKLSQQHHPDRGGDPDVMAEINAAYEILSDRDRKQRFDTTGQTDKATNLGEQCRRDTLQAIYAFIDRFGPEVNVLARMQNEIREGNIELQRKQRDVDAKIAKLTQRRAYVRRRDRAEEGNLFLLVIDDLLAKAALERESLDQRLALNLAALELLKDYEFEGPAVTPAGPFDQQQYAGLLGRGRRIGVFGDQSET